VILHVPPHCPVSTFFVIVVRCYSNLPRRSGDAAGYVTKCAGEGIYFAAKSGRMAGAAVSRIVDQTDRLPTQQQMIREYIRPYDRLYGPTYTVLDMLQRLFFYSNGAREAFVELCASKYVERLTFDSYLYKRVQGNKPLEDVKLLFRTLYSLVKGYFTSKKDAPYSNPVESLKRL
jgi:geranylgeranyl reductase